MAALFTVDKKLRVNDYYTGITKAFSQKTPLQNLLKRGAKPTDWAQECEVELAATPANLAAAEGGDFVRANLSSVTNLVLAHELQKFRSATGWQVTPESEMLPSHNELHGEKSVAYQMRKDAEKVVVSIENAIGSEQEAVLRGTGAAGIPKTRGLMCWLKKLDTDAATTHAVQTIPAALIPTAGIDGDVTSAAVFNEELFKDELVKAAIEAGDDELQLVGLCGLKLKKLMSEWLGKATTVQGVDTTVRATRDADSNSIGFIVDVFNYDGVTVKTMVDNHLLADTTTMACGAASYLSGAFIRPEFWSIDTLEALTNKDLPDFGGGKCGFHEAILRLGCRNPLGQFRIKYSA